MRGNAVVGDFEGELPAAAERQEGLGGGAARALLAVLRHRAVHAHVGHQGGGEGHQGQD